MKPVQLMVEQKLEKRI